MLSTLFSFFAQDDEFSKVDKKIAVDEMVIQRVACRLFDCRQNDCSRFNVIPSERSTATRDLKAKRNLTK